MQRKSPPQVELVPRTPRRTDSLRPCPSSSDLATQRHQSIQRSLSRHSSLKGDSMTKTQRRQNSFLERDGTNEGANKEAPCRSSMEGDFIPQTPSRTISSSERLEVENRTATETPCQAEEKNQSIMAAIPGKVMPSRYSIKAPPPVEM